MYYEIWQQFDPQGTRYIKYQQLSDFLDVLEPPLQIHKPNKYKIISMDIPICKGDVCYCVDVLDALTKDFFARKGNPVEETAELGEVTAQADRPGYEPISSTLWRQREEYCARMIQSAWRNQGPQDQVDGVSPEEEEDIISPQDKKPVLPTSSHGLDEEKKAQIRKNIKENLKRRDKENLKRRVSYPRGWPVEEGQTEEETAKAQEAANVLAHFVCDPNPQWKK